MMKSGSTTLPLRALSMAGADALRRARAARPDRAASTAATVDATSLKTTRRLGAVAISRRRGTLRPAADDPERGVGQDRHASGVGAVADLEGRPLHRAAQGAPGLFGG